MRDDRTPNLSIPLPHPDNSLEEDVARLRDAFQRVDQLLTGGDESTSALSNPHAMAIVLG